MISSEFIAECMAGDEESIQMLVRNHQRGVFQVALSILDCTEANQAETAAQAQIATRETFVAVLDRLGHYREDTPFETWLYGITILNSRRRVVHWRRERWLRALLRRAARIFIPWRKPTAGDGAQPSPSAETSPALQERTRRDEGLWQAVCALKDSLRLPVILRYYHDFSVEQIARMLNTGEGAVHARLDLAREKIAAQVGKTTSAE